VFFDLAGTLIHVRGGLGQQYADIAREFGANPDPRAIESVFAQAFQAAGPMPVRDAAAAERAFWKDVVRGVYDRVEAGMSASIFDRYFDRLFDHFAGVEAWDIYPDVEPTLDRLERAGFILGLITNFDQRVIPLLRALGLDRFFSTVVIPARAGAAKPHPGIFEYALAQHGLDPREAVQVGDSLEDDVAGARAAGWEAVLLDRPGRHVGVAPPAIRSLDELPGRLER
jgi:putative hydrolase of the HAD superfamily